MSGFSIFFIISYAEEIALTEQVYYFYFVEFVLFTVLTVLDFSRLIAKG
jgi:hypothetical protein